MAIEWSVIKHTLCNPGALLAQDYGRHMVSINIDEATDNGTIVTVGKMTSLDNWEIKSKTGVLKAYIAMKGVDGTYLVVVDEVSDNKTALIYQQPIINEESPKALTSLYNFYNDPEDGAVRGYILEDLDRFWLSADGFSGEAPKVGATISTFVDGKLVVDAASDEDITG